MAGYKNFQVDRNKYKNGIKDIYKKPKKVNRTLQIKSRDQKLRDGFKTWTAFYRANIHRFIEDYMGVKLFFFQKILIYMLDKSSFFTYIAARGQGKSFLIAVYCIARAILYPNSAILLASGTKNQARLIITQKIEKDLYHNYPNIAREIKNIKTGTNQCVVYFQNGSTIEAVTSTDSSRGYRGNILICDEFRLISKDNITKVLRPFLNVNRQPPYLKNPKYAYLQEENKEIYISSAWFKNHWIWNHVKAYRNAMCKGEDYTIAVLPYQLSIYHGLLSRKRIEQIQNEDDFDPISFMMEYECLFFGESEKAFFKLNDMQSCRTLVKPFYPRNNIDFVSNKKKRFKTTKQAGEIRIIGADVAMMEGAANDNTIYTLMRLLPSGFGYIRQIPYIESMNGQHSEKQAIRLKQLFMDFEADYVAMDTNGNGISLFDDCCRVLYDEDRDVEYPAWTSINDDKMKNRSLDANALPVVYSIKVVKQEVNHIMATSLRNCFQKKKIKLLQNEIEGKEFLVDKMNYSSLSPEDQAALLRPYIQTTALVNEMVNLEGDTSGGFVKVKEIGKNRKDRYSSLAYANYYADILEKELMDDEIDEDDELIYY
jgi:hypothetical protein